MERRLFVAIPFFAACLVFGGLFFLLRTGHVTARSTAYIPQGTILVTTLEDELLNDGDCSLREAIAAANDNTAVDGCPAGEEVFTDTITFENAGIITVTSQLSVTAGGPLIIDGGKVISTSGGGATRVWWVEEGSVVYLIGVNIIAGYLEDESGAGLSNNHGIVTITDSIFSGNDAWECGGLRNNGTLTISLSRISNNRDRIFMGGGGAICNNGILFIDQSSIDANQGNEGSGITNSDAMTVTNSFISENTAYFGGGGIHNNIGANLAIYGSTLRDNSAGQGGAVINDGYTVVVSSTISGNHSGEGGGILNRQELIISDSTISGNSVGMYGQGGGVDNEGWLVVQNSTFSANLAVENLGMGGGINNSNATVIINSSTFKDNRSQLGGYAINNDEFGFGEVTISNSILDSLFINCGGTIMDGGYNVENHDSCGFEPANGSLPNSIPHLGPLQDNGGPTWTHALLWHSAAIDAGDNAFCLPADQRGLPRPMDGNGDGVAVCDIGAFEAQEPVFPPYILFLPTMIRTP